MSAAPGEGSQSERLSSAGASGPSRPKDCIGSRPDGTVSRRGAQAQALPPNSSFERTAGHKVQAMIEKHFIGAASGVVSLRPAAAQLGC